jgi:hypothetical protein
MRNDTLVAVSYVAVAMAATMGPYLALQIMDGAYSYQSNPNSTYHK